MGNPQELQQNIPYLHDNIISDQNIEETGSSSNSIIYNFWKRHWDIKYAIYYDATFGEEFFKKSVLYNSGEYGNYNSYKKKISFLFS